MNTNTYKTAGYFFWQHETGSHQVSSPAGVGDSFCRNRTAAAWS